MPNPAEASSSRATRPRSRPPSFSNCPPTYSLVPTRWSASTLASALPARAAGFWTTPDLKAPVVASSTANPVTAWPFTVVNLPPTNTEPVAGSVSRASTPLGSSSVPAGAVMAGANAAAPRARGGVDREQVRLCHDRAAGHGHDLGELTAHVHGVAEAGQGAHAQVLGRVRDPRRRGRKTELGADRRRARDDAHGRQEGRGDAPLSPRAATASLELSTGLLRLVTGASPTRSLAFNPRKAAEHRGMGQSA